MDRLLSVVDGEIVPVCWFDGAGEEFSEADDGLLKTFKLISVGVVGFWADDDGTCNDVPVPSETARPSNWIDSVAVDAVMVSKTFC